MKALIVSALAIPRLDKSGTFVVSTRLTGLKLETAFLLPLVLGAYYFCGFDIYILKMNILILQKM